MWHIPVGALALGTGPYPLTEERTIQHRFEITRPEYKTKPKKATKPKPKERKPKVPTRTAEEQIEAQQQCDRNRSQTPERKEAARLHAQKVRQERKANGQCRGRPWDTEVLLEHPPKGPAAPATLQEACELRHSDIVNATRVFSRLH